MMQCQHAIGGTASLVLCAFLDRMADRSKCETCPHFVAGQADPLPMPDLVSASPSPVDCVHRGDSLFDEPCSCGSSSMVAVYACHSPERVRNFQQHAWCVPLSIDWNRLADQMARTSFQCCESCERRTPCSNSCSNESDNFRQNTTISTPNQLC